ncbi:MAG: hypothetical protein OHK0035_02010 [Cyanobacteria bacterium J069]
MLDGETRQHELTNEFEFESEFEYELQNEYEVQHEYEGEEFLGGLVSGAMNALGLGEGESEYEGEYESEAFLSTVRKLAGRLKPILPKMIPHVTRLIGTALGGPKLGATLGQVMRESEYEFEYETGGQFEFEGELAGEFEYETAPQMEAVAEALAGAAVKAQNEAEAEAYAGAAVTRVLSSKSAAVQKQIPAIVKASAQLTRGFRQHPSSRILVRTLPTIVQRTGQALTQKAAQGQPITRPVVAQVMATQTRNTLKNPLATAKLIANSAKAAQKVTQPTPTARKKVRG